ncbi:hypothetical protein DMB44_00380 [Thermoplasma sp. Kam2015]|nr:hypothetical protein DMB44_00380 [Thermoplasma sp. Kam2015]
MIMAARPMLYPYNGERGSSYDYPGRHGFAHSYFLKCGRRYHITDKNAEESYPKCIRTARMQFDLENTHPRICRVNSRSDRTCRCDVCDPAMDGDQSASKNINKIGLIKPRSMCLNTRMGNSQPLILAKQ